MKKIKTLYKLSRKKLFEKSYLCKFCEMIDYEKEYIQKHIEQYHDENSKYTKILECKKCGDYMTEEKVIYHYH